MRDAGIIKMIYTFCEQKEIRSAAAATSGNRTRERNNKMQEEQKCS
jgi:hypothetical protein